MQNESNYEAYSDYAKNLRMWFIGFGIGGPVLLIGNKSIISQAKCLSILNEILLGFVIGVVCQISLSIVNKYINWILYNCRGIERTWPINRKIEWTSKQITIDMILDLTTVLAFVVSGYGLIITLTSML